MGSIDSEVHSHLLNILDVNHVPTKERSGALKKAYYYYYAYTKELSSSIVVNPVTGKQEPRVVFTKNNLIVVCTEEKASLIDFYYRRSKVDGARKLKARMDDLYIGIGEKDIQSFINKSKINRQIKGKFDNKPPLHPVTSKKIWSQIQIDLMSMADKPVLMDGKEYKWVLSVIDILSRYLVLRPLHSKDTVVIARELLQVFGAPSRVQCDRGSEFQGSVEAVARELQIQIIHSSVRHPQCQRKVGTKLFAEISCAWNFVLCITH